MATRSRVSRDRLNERAEQAIECGPKMGRETEGLNGVGDVAWTGFQCYPS